MTPPFSSPGAAAKPPAETPRVQGVPGVPRPTMVSNGNLGTPVVRGTPRVQAPSTAMILPGDPMNAARAAGAALPAARARMPLAPHAPTAGVPRPMANFGGGAQMTAAPSPAPRMQAGPPTAKVPGIPPNARAVGAAVQYANPAAPSLGKRAPAAMGPAPVPPAKRHAPMRGPQGAATMGGAAPAAGVRAPVPPGHAAPSMPPPLPKLTYVGVYRDPSKGWMARAMDLKRRAARSIGPFDDPHQAALAHDRVAVACAGRGIRTAKQLNFGTSFYRVETAFLQRWEGDVCDAVESGEYEKIYARFLRAGFRAAMNIKEGDEGGEQTTDELMIASCVGDGGFFWDDIENFFIYRAGEIGEEALGDEAWEKDGQGRGRELLQKRFVEMHRNKSLCAVWRRKNYMEKMKTMMMQNQQRQQQVQIQMEQPQQQQIPRQQQQVHLQQQQVHLQQQQQIHMQQQQQQIQQQQIQMQQQRRQQQFQQHQMMIQKQHQQQLMMAQQQEQQCLDHDAICSLGSGEIVNSQTE